MNWKTIPWVLGVALLAVSLVAARLMNADTPVNPGAGANAAAKPVFSPNGLTVLGWVDSLPTVTRIDSPGVIGMPALTIQKVLVGNGDVVEVGQVLVEFDAGTFKHDQVQAEQELIAAQWEVQQAKLGSVDWEEKKKLQKIAVEAAETELKYATDGLDRAREVFERALSEIKQFGTNNPLTEEQKKQRRQENEGLLKLEGAVALLKLKVEKEHLDLKRLNVGTTDSQGNAIPAAAIDIQRANAKVGSIQSRIEKAKAVIESFKLKAQVAGTVEQVNAVAGMTFGATTRTPLLYVVPAGKRIVHAEVEAEFAYRIDSQRGKAVTICDQHDTALTYTGTIVRVPSAFLPKRFGGDSLVGNSTRVLECTIEVTDASPAGKPPLRPGQAVRVVFGQ